MTMTRRQCQSVSIQATAEKKICCFCGRSEENELEYGKFYEHKGIVTHYYCLLLSSNMEQKGKDNEGILGFLPQDIQKELRRGKRLCCSFCKKSGATLGCCNVRCKKIFHLPCGLKNGSLHQFFGEFKSFCSNHRPEQKIDERVKQDSQLSHEKLCYICYDEINIKDTFKTLWAPCCKKNAWFHRTCVQQLAMSAGYFFKCPLCNSKKEFQTAMLEYGVYIPCQDASWELVPNAYEELLYRHNRCDAPKCLCPKGRSHTSSNAKWELTLCRLCGSQGIHMACGQLKWANPSWECVECTSITSKSTPQVSNTNRIEAKTPIDKADSDSDSDISVGGRTSPILHTASIRLKPGPRCFKLLQARLSASNKSTSNNSMKRTLSENTTIEKNVNHTLKKDNLPLPTIDKKCENQPNIEHSSEEVIMIESDDDDTIEIVSEKLTKTIKDSRKSQTLSTNEKLESNVASVLQATNKTGKNISVSAVANVKSSNKFPTTYPSDNNSTETLASSSQQTLASLTPCLQPEKFNPLIVNDNVDSSMTLKISMVTSISPEMHAKLPDSSVTQVAEQKVQKRPAVMIPELSDTSIAQASDPKLQSTSPLLPAEMLVPQNTIADINQSALRRKRVHEEQNVEENKHKKKRKCIAKSNIIDNILPNMLHNFANQNDGNKISVKLPCSLSLRNIGFQEEVVQNNNNESNDVLNPEDITKENKDDILGHAIKSAGSTCNTNNSNMCNDNANLLALNQPSTSSMTGIFQNDNSLTKANMMYCTSGNQQICGTSMVQPQNCDGDAGTSPADEPGFGNDSRVFTNECKSDTSRSSTPNCEVRRSYYKCTDTTSASSSNNEKTISDNSTSFTVLEPSCDRTGLMKKRICLQDIKFRLCGENNLLEIILYNEYKFNVDMDDVEKQKKFNNKKSRVCQTSKLKNTSQLKSHDSQRYIDDSESSRHSADQQETNDSMNSTHSRVRSTHFEDAKENLDPIISYANEESRAALLCEKRSVLSHFSPRNVDNLTDEEDGTTQINGTEKDHETLVNCKVSIDLNKIGNVIGNSSDLFDKSNVDIEAEESEEMTSEKVLKSARSGNLDESKTITNISATKFEDE